MRKSTKRLLFLVAAVLALASNVYWKSDTRRLSLFHAHKSDYEVLLNMLHEDAVLTFINSGLTVPEDPAAPRDIRAKNCTIQTIHVQDWLRSHKLRVREWPDTICSDATGAPNILYFPTRSAEDAKKSGVPVDKPPAQAHHIEGNWYLSSENF